MISRRSGSLTNLFSDFLTRLRRGRIRRPQNNQKRRQSATPLEVLEQRALLSALTISSDDIRTESFTLSADDTASGGDDLQIQGASTVQSTTGSLTFNIGDNGFWFQGTTVEAATTITINADIGNLDADGSDIGIASRLIATAVNFTSGPDDDFIGFGEDAYQTTPINVDAGGGDNNQLNPDLGTVASPVLTFTGTGAGVLSSSSHQDITFSGIANVIPQTGSFSSVVVDLSQFADGDNGAADDILIERTATNIYRFTVNGSVVGTVQDAGISSISVIGSTDSDTLTVDHSGNTIAIPISFEGSAGGGSDSLAVIGNGSTNAVYTPDAATQGNGTVAVDGGGAAITFTGLEPVDISNMTTATLTLPGTNDSLTLTPGTGFADTGNQAIRVSGSSGGVAIEDVAFFDNTNVVIDTTSTAGTDAITVQGAANGHGNQNLTINTGGTTGDGDVINLNGDVTTSGTQTYGNAAINMGADAVLTSSGGGNISLSGAIDGGQSLTVDTSGSISLGGNIGASTPLSSLTTDAGTAIQLPAIVTTTGDQTYNDALTLPTDAVLSGAAILVSGDIEGTSSGNQSLTINATGASSFDGNIGASTPLASLTTDAGGSNLLPAIVTTTGTQTYNDDVILTADTTLTAATIVVNDDIEGTTTGAESLNVNGDLILGDGAGDYIGRATPLGSLSVSGTTTINATPVSPPTIATSDAGGDSGNQVYSGPVVLSSGADTTLNATGGDVTFQSTVDGPASLVVNADGITTFLGAVGATTAVESLTTDAVGSTFLNANVSTSTGQVYNDAVSLGANVTTTGLSVAINSTVALDSNTLSVAAISTGNAITGSISGTGGLAYNGSGVGVLTLSGASSYTGTTTVTSGTVRVDDAAALGASQGSTVVAAAGTVEIASNITLLENFDLSGGLDVSAGTSAIVNGLVTLSSGASFGSADAAGDLEITSNVIGTGGFTKTGAGALNLSGGANTFTGNVSLQDGTTNLTGTSAAGANYDVASGATLVSDSAISGTVTGSGGTIDPGPGILVLDTGDLILGSGSTLSLDLAGKATPGTDYDQINVTGTVNVGGVLDLTDTSMATGTTDDEIVLINNDGTDAVVGTFDSLAPGSAVTINGEAWRILYDGGDGNDVVLAFSTPTITVADVSIAEGDSGTTNLTFSVVLDGPVGGEFDVNYSVADQTARSDDGDFTSDASSIRFAGTLASETQTIDIAVSGDEKVELDETFLLSLINVAPVSNTFTPVITDDEATGTITNDDAATISIDDVSLDEGDAGTTAFTFTATLDAAVDSGLSIDFDLVAGSAVAGSDFAVGNGSVNFTGNAGETREITVGVIGETDPETDEDFTIQLSNVQASGRAVTIDDGEGLGTIVDDDRVPVTLSANVSAGDEATSTEITLTATADSAVAGDQTFDLAVTGTNVTSADYALSDMTVRILDGQTTGTVTFTVQDDDVVELSETATVTLTNPSAGARPGSTTSVDLTLSSDDSAQLSIDDVSINEGDTGTAQLTFTVTLDTAVDSAVAVDFATADDTAIDGEDYTAVSSTLDFSGTAGETATITVDIAGDEVVELNEALLVNLSNLAASGRDVTLADAQGEGTVTNDDTATLTITDVSLSEGDSDTTDFVFTVAVDNAVDTGFTVAYDTADDTANAGSDYTADTGGTLSFSGTAGENQTITIQVSGDTVVEASEEFFVNLGAISAGGRNVIAPTPQAVGTITNDDTPAAVNLGVSANSGTEAGTTEITLTVTADNPVVGDQTIDIAVSGAGITADDYTLSASTITIADGATTGTATFTVQDDAVVELAETATVAITTASLGVSLGATTSQEISIADDDAATLSIDDVSMDEGDSGDTLFTFTVTLDVAVDTSLTVDYDTVAGTATIADGDFTANTGNFVTFSGTAGETKTFDVLVAGDEKVELDESFLVNLSNITAAGRSVTFADSQGQGTVLNDDVANLTIDDVSIDEGNSGTTDFVFTVTLDAEVDTPVTVEYATAGDTASAGADYTAIGATTLSFTGAANQSRTLTVSVAGETLEETDERFFVNLSNLAAGGRNVVLNDDQGIGTIIDDDGIEVNLSASANVATEADQTVITLTATALSAVSGEQTVDLVVSGMGITNDDYTLSSATITIPDGQTTGTATFTVANDDVTELTEAAVIQLSNPSTGISQGATASQTVTITDNDASTLSISDPSVTEGDDGTATLSFIVTLDSAVDTAFTVDAQTADDSATAGSDYTSAAQTLSFSGSAGETQAFDVEVTGDTLVELSETLGAMLSTVSASGRDVTIQDDTGTGTITNDDTATLSIDSVSQSEGSSATTTFTFTVTLDSDVDAGVDVDFATADGTATVADGDYTANSGSLSFTGTAGETRTIDVLVTGDTDIEDDEAFTVLISNPSASGRTVSISTDTGTADIVDDDGIPVSLGLSGTSGSEATGTVITLVAVAASPVTGDQTVEVSITGSGIDTNDYTLSSNTITISDGQTIGTVTLTVEDDALVESDETAIVTLSNPSSGLSLSGSVSGSIDLISDDAGSVSINDISVVEGSSSTSTLTFTVSLDVDVPGGFTVDYATADDAATTADSDYAAASGTLSFAGTAGETQTVTVNVIGDEVAELDETFFVNLSNLAGNTTPVQIGDAQGTGTILTDDDITVDLSVNGSTASERNGAAVTVTATASEAVAGDQTVTVSVSGTGITAGDYTLSDVTITIPDGQTTGTVAFTASDDGVLEISETATITISAPSAGIFLGTTTSQDVVIEDNKQEFAVLDNIDRYPGNQPELTWQEVPGAARYEIWFSRLFPNQGRILHNTELTSASYPVPVQLAPAMYRYWVRAFDSNGDPAGWSAPKQFEVQPTLVAPLNPTFSARPTFTWNPIPFATSYQIFVRARGEDIVVSDIAETSWTPNTDLPEGPIRWWIRATDSFNNFGWSVVGETNTDTRTELLSPSGTITTSTPTLTWQPVDGASRYILHVQNLDATGSEAVAIREDQLTGTSFTPSTALPNANYRFWVKAIDGATNNFADSAWSFPENFTISVSAVESSGLLDSLLETEDTEAESLAVFVPQRKEPAGTTVTTKLPDSIRSRTVAAVNSEDDMKAKLALEVEEHLEWLDDVMSQPIELAAAIDRGRRA